MPFSREQIEANAAWFRAKLAAVRQKNDVVKWTKGEGGLDFVVADVRGREAFAKGHVRGAACVPIAEIETLARTLPRDKPIAAFCWNHL